MKHLKLRLILLVLLVCLAFASAAFALKPLIDGAEKSIEVKQAVEEYRETISEIREEAEKAKENEEQHEPIPYAQLYEDMQFYNRQLYLFKQADRLRPARRKIRHHYDPEDGLGNASVSRRV